MKRSGRKGRRNSCAHRKRNVDPLRPHEVASRIFHIRRETLQGLAEARTPGRAFPRLLYRQLLFHTCGGRRLKLITAPCDLKVLLFNGAERFTIYFLALCSSATGPLSGRRMGKLYHDCIAFSTAAL
jgi:hypothetical protein